MGEKVQASSREGQQQPLHRAFDTSTGVEHAVPPQDVQQAEQTASPGYGTNDLVVPFNQITIQQTEQSVSPRENANLLIDLLDEVTTEHAFSACHIFGVFLPGRFTAMDTEKDIKFLKRIRRSSHEPFFPGTTMFLSAKILYRNILYHQQVRFMKFIDTVCDSVSTQERERIFDLPRTNGRRISPSGSAESVREHGKFDSPTSHAKTTSVHLRQPVCAFAVWLLLRLLL